MVVISGVVVVLGVDDSVVGAGVVTVVVVSGVIVMLGADVSVVGACVVTVVGG